MKTIRHSLSLLLLLPLGLLAQLPQTDIWIARAEQNPMSGKDEYRKLEKITGFYDYENQPMFTPDGKQLMFAAVNDMGQSDLYYYDLTSGFICQWNYTPESEYSPTITPDGKHISVVRVEKDSTQRLWQFPVTGGKPQLLFPTHKEIGYFGWCGANEVMCFLVKEPSRLVRFSEGAEEKVIAENVGRTIVKIPNQDAVSFVRKEKGRNMICRYDLKTGAVTDITSCPSNLEDFVWVGDEIWMPSGSQILVYNRNLYGIEWKPVFDFSASGAKDLYRIAVSADRRIIALVNRVAAQ